MLTSLFAPGLVLLITSKHDNGSKRQIWFKEERSEDKTEAYNVINIIKLAQQQKWAAASAEKCGAVLRGLFEDFHFDHRLDVTYKWQVFHFEWIV